MKNPLIKRIPKEFKNDLGKYLVIFLFMIMLISMVSGFMVVTGSLRTTFDDDIELLLLEDGHVTFSNPIKDDLKAELEEKGKLKLYELYNFDQDIKGTELTIRIYKIRTDINKTTVMEGQMPSTVDEIVLDRLFVRNNNLAIGDSIELGGRKLKITGTVAFSDYSCLFENNSDMMFDSSNFSPALLTDEGFDKFENTNIKYTYAWLYPENIDRTDTVTATKRSDSLIESLTEVLETYNKNLIATAMESGMQMNEIEKNVVKVEDYLPRYANKSINFGISDVDGDRGMFLIFGYIVIAVIAFVFAVTTSNTIAADAGVIGTLRASGYTKGELIIHYMILPVSVTLFSALVGNVIGYTVLEQFMEDIEYNSFSFAPIRIQWNAEAFVLTTVVPLILMFVINLFVLVRKMALSPLRFLRRDLSKRGKKKAFKLNTKIPILVRFRLRVIFQNIPNYVTLFLGIFLGGCIIVFGTMFGPLLDEYTDQVVKTRLADYQYVVMNTNVSTDNIQAEKYAVESLETYDTKFLKEEINIMGIADDSKYVKTDIPEGRVIVSNGMMDKYGLSEGDKLSLKDGMTGKIYEFTVAGEYTYDAALTLFMPIEEFRKTFDKEDDYFTGFFSNERLEDIAEEDIATVITEQDLSKLARQMKISMGDFMKLFVYFGVMMFLLLMYILSKQIIEKNAKSIAMTKILGFKGGEIGGLYIAATSIVVAVSLLVSIPIIHVILKWAMTDFLYTEMTGYIPYIVSKMCYVYMCVLGALCYAFVAFLQMRKIGKIPKGDALKMVE